MCIMCDFLKTNPTEAQIELMRKATHSVDVLGTILEDIAEANPKALTSDQLHRAMNAVTVLRPAEDPMTEVLNKLFSGTNVTVVEVHPLPGETNEQAIARKVAEVMGSEDHSDKTKH